MLDVTKRGQINLDSVMFDLYAIPLLSKACHQLLNQVHIFILKQLLLLVNQTCPSLGLYL